jgi:carboxyl-terminal processing protease
VQEVDPLPDGSSLRYTIAKWYSPSGKSIDHEGIEPDRLVEITEDDIKNKFDRQLDEAKKYLKTL